MISWKLACLGDPSVEAGSPVGVAHLSNLPFPDDPMPGGRMKCYLFQQWQTGMWPFQASLWNGSDQVVWVPSPLYMPIDTHGSLGRMQKFFHTIKWSNILTPMVPKAQLFGTIWLWSVCGECTNGRGEILGHSRSGKGSSGQVLAKIMGRVAKKWRFIGLGNRAGNIQFFFWTSNA